MSGSNKKSKRKLPSGGRKKDPDDADNVDDDDEDDDEEEGQEMSKAQGKSKSKGNTARAQLPSGGRRKKRHSDDALPPLSTEELAEMQISGGEPWGEQWAGMPKAAPSSKLPWSTEAQRERNKSIAMSSDERDKMKEKEEDAERQAQSKKTAKKKPGPTKKNRPIIFPKPPKWNFLPGDMSNHFPAIYKKEFLKGWLKPCLIHAFHPINELKRKGTTGLQWVIEKEVTGRQEFRLVSRNYGAPVEDNWFVLSTELKEAATAMGRKNNSITLKE